MKTNKNTKVVHVHSTKIMKLYCLSTMSTSSYFVKCLKYYYVSKNKMRYSALGRTRWNGSLAAKDFGVRPPFDLVRLSVEPYRYQMDVRHYFKIEVHKLRKFSFFQQHFIFQQCLWGRNVVTFEQSLFQLVRITNISSSTF